MWYGVSLFWIGRARRDREVVQLGGMNHVQIDQINQTLNLARINKHFCCIWCAVVLISPCERVSHQSDSISGFSPVNRLHVRFSLARFGLAADEPGTCQLRRRSLELIP